MAQLENVSHKHDKIETVWVCFWPKTQMWLISCDQAPGQKWTAEPLLTPARARLFELCSLLYLCIRGFSPCFLSQAPHFYIHFLICPAVITRHLIFPAHLFTCLYFPYQAVVFYQPFPLDPTPDRQHCFVASCVWESAILLFPWTCCPLLCPSAPLPLSLPHSCYRLGCIESLFGLVKRFIYVHLCSE